MAYKPPSNNNGRTHGGSQIFFNTIDINPQRLASIHERHVGSLLRLLGVVYPALGEGSRGFNSLHLDHLTCTCDDICLRHLDPLKEAAFITLRTFKLLITGK